MAELKSGRKILLINLGIGNLEIGLPNITVQLISDENGKEHQHYGELPPEPELIKLYQEWKRYYQVLHERLAWGSRMFIPSTEEECRVSEDDFQVLCQKLGQTINDWLISSSFRRVESRFRTILQPNDHIQVIIETEDDLLRRLPWHLWSFFEDYPQAEITLSPRQWQPISLSKTPYGTVRILAVFGNSDGINLEEERIQLESLLTLPETDIVFLEHPTLQILTTHLSDTQGWDILFFAGHSSSAGDTGWLYINEHDSLNIVQLRNALIRAISNGLHIAIFNSCDGLGLAQELERLNLSRIIVMREPVSDFVAHTFSKYFLNEFASGKSFFSAVRYARQQLQGLEDQYPCASWLPVICQHPQAPGGSWKEMQYPPGGVNWIIQLLLILFGIGNVQKRWWNRPLIGEKSFIERLITMYIRIAGKPVPTDVIRTYNELIGTAEKFNQSAKKFERQRYGNPELKKFIKLKQSIDHGQYKGLSRYIGPLIAGLEVRQRYLSLGRTAFEYRGRYHQEYYKYVDALILDKTDRRVFLDEITEKYEELIPGFKTDIGLARFKFYWSLLKGIASHELQYRLLYSFKINKDIHYTVLAETSEIIFKTNPKDILHTDNLNKYILNYQELFTKLDRLIGLPNNWNNLEVHNVILQYAIFKVRYPDNPRIYKVFLERIKLMEPKFLQINKYRQEYTKLGYRLNIKFLQPVPGQAVYNKYKKYLEKDNND